MKHAIRCSTNLQEGQTASTVPGAELAALTSVPTRKSRSYWSDWPKCGGKQLCVWGKGE